MTSVPTVAAAAFAATLLSGLIALYLRAHKAVVYAFCAGALIGGAVLLLIPDARRLLASSGTSLPAASVWGVAVFGFLVFYVLERGQHRRESRRLAGLSGGIGLAVHSFIDGVVIGQGFQAGEETGVILTLAVLSHKLADGVGAVALMLETEHTVRQTMVVLMLIAVAPLLGVLAQSFVILPASLLALLLSLFAGMLLYLGSSHLLPEAMHNQREPSSVPLVFLAGLAVVYGAHLLP